MNCRSSFISGYMKKIIITFALLVLFPWFGKTQITFNKLENYNNPVSSATNVKRIGDNYFVQYLFLDSSLTQGIGILKTDEYGNVLKKIEFIDTSFWYGSISFRNLIATTDSFLVMAANRYYNQLLRKEKVEIWKFDTNLDIIWTKLIDHPDTADANLPGAEKLVRIQDIVESSLNEYVMSISYNRKCLDASDFSNRRALLLNIDTAGNFIWMNRNGELYKDLISLDITSDSGFIVPTIRGGIGLPYNINKFDYQGNFKWKIDANAYYTQTHALAACEYDSLSVIMATFYKINVLSGEYGVTVFKFNTFTKTVEWNRDFILAEKMVSINLLQTMPMEIRVGNRGDIFIATSGFHTTYNPWYESKYYGIVLKLNSSGDSLWTKYYNYNGNDIFDTELQGFMIEDDGSFVGVGYGMLQSGSSQKLWFFKTDTNAYLGFDNSAINENDFIRIYPNPTSDLINIELSNIIHSDIELALYDITGRKIIARKSTNSQKYVMDISKLSSGIYLLNVLTDAVNIKSVKIIKE